MAADSEVKPPAPIDKWNMGAVKIALDDAAKDYLMAKFGLVENNRIVDGRLFLSTLCVLLAGYGTLWDYLYPHPASRMVLIICVLSYFVISSLTTLYITFIQKNIFFVGDQPDKAGIDPADSWYVSSSMYKYDPTYHFSITVKEGVSRKTREYSGSWCVSEFFDNEGNLRMDLYEPAILKLISNEDKKKK